MPSAQIALPTTHFLLGHDRKDHFRVEILVVVIAVVHRVDHGLDDGRGGAGRILKVGSTTEVVASVLPLPRGVGAYPKRPWRSSVVKVTGGAGHRRAIRGDLRKHRRGGLVISCGLREGEWRKEGGRSEAGGSEHSVAGGSQSHQEQSPNHGLEREGPQAEGKMAGAHSSSTTKRTAGPRMSRQRRRHRGRGLAPPSLWAGTSGEAPSPTWLAYESRQARQFRSRVAGERAKRVG